MFTNVHWEEYGQPEIRARMAGSVGDDYETDGAAEEESHSGEASRNHVGDWPWRQATGFIEVRLEGEIILVSIVRNQSSKKGLLNQDLRNRTGGSKA